MKIFRTAAADKYNCLNTLKDALARTAAAAPGVGMYADAGQAGRLQEAPAWPVQLQHKPHPDYSEWPEMAVKKRITYSLRNLYLCICARTPPQPRAWAWTQPQWLACGDAGQCVAAFCAGDAAELGLCGD